MRFMPIACATTLALLTSSCMRPCMDQRKAITWLDSKTGAPDLNLAGQWESTSGFMTGGWGYGNWTQSGSQIIGTLGLYSVEGRVAGKKFYLLLLSRGCVYYTAVLELSPEGELTGIAYGNALPDDPEARFAERAPISLVRSQKR